MQIKTTIAIGFFLSMCVVACDRSPTLHLPEDGNGIINGSPIRNKDELGKSVVALMARRDDGVALCSGSILDSETILTAAHCVDDNPERLSVIFGPKIQNAPLDMVRSGDRYVQNTRWKKPGKNGRGDLALVHFSGGLPDGFQPVQLATSDSDLTVGTEVVMVGYGVSNGTENKGAGVLRATATTIEGRASRTEIFTDGRKASVCFGDSGGPAFIETDGGFTQWGVASSVLSNACNEASIHTSVIEYEAWIRSAAAHLASP